MAARQPLEQGHKRKFLVIVDDTPECARAVQFASRRADRTGGGLVLLHVIPPATFQQWKGVENIMRAEAMEKAEALLHSEGLRQVRVRDHGDVARIECLGDQIDRLMEPQRRRRIDEALRGLGYRFVAVDLRGYRTGSLNPV